jgi:hypothetical protein
MAKRTSCAIIHNGGSNLSCHATRCRPSPSLAIETYARQAKNTEAERQACEIRLRAEQRCGQLLRQMKTEGRMAKGGAPYHAVNRTGDGAEPVESGNSLLADWSITKRQSHNWQHLANVSDDDFERAVTQPGASTSGI